MSSRNNYLIGISGGSASGKTHLLQKIMDNFDDGSVTLVSQDNYYFPRETLKKDEHGLVNFDHPDTVDLDAFSRDMQKLRDGETVELLEYTFNNSEKTPEKIVYEPAPVIIVEGLFVFYERRINELLDLRIFVEAEEHLKLIRRIIRDYEERGYGLDDVLVRYENHVIPMFRKYVLPYKSDCNILVPSKNELDKAAEVISDHIRMQLK